MIMKNFKYYVYGFVIFFLFSAEELVAQKRINVRSSIFILQNDKEKTDSCLCDEKKGAYYFVDSLNYVNWVSESFCVKRFFIEYDTIETPNHFEYRKRDVFEKHFVNERFRISKSKKWLYYTSFDKKAGKSTRIPYCNITKGGDNKLRDGVFLKSSGQNSELVKIRIGKKDTLIRFNGYKFRCIEIIESINRVNENYESHIFYDKNLLIPIYIVSYHNIEGLKEANSDKNQSNEYFLFSIMEMNVNWVTRFLNGRVSN